MRTIPEEKWPLVCDDQTLEIHEKKYYLFGESGRVYGKGDTTVEDVMKNCGAHNFSVDVSYLGQEDIICTGRELVDELYRRKLDVDVLGHWSQPWPPLMHM